MAECLPVDRQAYKQSFLAEFELLMQQVEGVFPLSRQVSAFIPFHLP